MSLDNKLNQYDAAVTVQRAVRQALTRIGLDLKPELVLAEVVRADLPHRVDRGAARRHPLLRQVAGHGRRRRDRASSSTSRSRPATSPRSSPSSPTFAKVDDKSFTLTTKKPVVTLDSLMSNILITPAAANKAEELRDGIGSGPFTVAAADSGTGTYRLVRNENYWGEKALLDEVNVSYQEEEGARVIALTSGQTDVIDTITPESAASLKSNKDIEVLQTKGTRLIHLFYNFRKPAGHPLSKPAVREALSHAIDHDALIKLADGRPGDLRRGRGPHHPRRLRQDRQLHLRRRQGEVDARRRGRLRAQAPRHLGGLGVRRCGPGHGGHRRRCSPTWASRWSSSRSPRAATSTPGVAARPATGTSWATATATRPGWRITNLQGQYGGTAEKEKTRDTYHGFVFPEVTSLLDEASQNPDVAARNAQLKEAQEKIWALWPAMWAWTPNNLLARRKRVTTLDLSPGNFYDLSTVKVSG